ncbi:Lysosomal Pro-X carboxypeptidase [Geodia barretti]|uniref:Lysosomal Pro-X carboxypeptidase n=1 Tax=Geodia barretti TaxID=519541 RepID=A0AA35TRE0_GEOBA|nr:Lysosomal Pro-X carboxypeptidase [Geodia barretti]
MVGIVRLLVAISSLTLLVRAAPSPPKYVELYTEQMVDHFNYELQDTFMERYFLSNVYWKGSGPLFFYTGNEGAIEGFYDNTGFLFELAENFSALIVFAEHRYYGKSLPYGESTFTLSHIGYLTAEQALADYAVLISRLRTQYRISKVISFGGSYGGMLSAWFRFKYPNSVDGALAASAPIYIVANLTSPYAFFGLVTQDFEKVDSRCPLYVREAYAEIDTLAAQGEEGLKQITEAFELCSPLTSDKVYLKNSSKNIHTSFLAPLPAYPVTVACNSLVAAESKLHGLAQAADISTASNIIFSNGDLDPWSVGGVTESLSESLTAILIKGGAHHLDLRFSNPADPPSVIEAREKEKEIIAGWIKS